MQKLFEDWRQYLKEESWEDSIKRLDGEIVQKITAKDLPAPAILIPGSVALLRSMIANAGARVTGSLLGRSFLNIVRSKVAEKLIFVFLTGADFAYFAVTIGNKMSAAEEGKELGALEEWLVDRGVPFFLIGGVFKQLYKLKQMQGMRWYDPRVIAIGFIIFKIYEFLMAHPKELAGIGVDATEQDQKRAVDLAYQFSKKQKKPETKSQSQEEPFVLTPRTDPLGGVLFEYGAAGMGGNIATLAGVGLQPMAAITPQYKEPIAQGEDLAKSLKAVIFRNDKVLLLKNDRGWDLPGGHMKQDENLINGLKREVFEETGLTISDPQDLHMSHGHKQFYSAQLPTDDVKLSDEHFEYGFFTVEQIKEMDDVADYYKKAIFQAMGYNLTESRITKIKISIGV